VIGHFAITEKPMAAKTLGRALIADGAACKFRPLILRRVLSVNTSEWFWCISDILVVLVPFVFRRAVVGRPKTQNLVRLTKLLALRPSVDIKASPIGGDDGRSGTFAGTREEGAHIGCKGTLQRLRGHERIVAT
jgi:hypothetical protein